MECHKCRHNEDVATGRYAGVEFAKTPCAKCELKAGGSFAIEFDDERPGIRIAGSVLEAEPLVEDVHFAEERDAEVGPWVPVDALYDLVATLLMLSPRTRDVVCWRYAGYKYRDIALVQRVTASAVELRHREALKRHPLLRCLFAAKAGRQKSRKRHAVAGVEVPK